MRSLSSRNVRGLGLGLACSIALGGCSSSGTPSKGDAASASGGSPGAGGAGTGGTSGAGGRTGSGGGAGMGGAGTGGAAAGTGGRRGTGGGTDAGGQGTGGGSGVGGAPGTGGRKVDGGGDGPASCTGGYSDDFSGADLDPCWTILNGSDPANPLITTSVSNGALHLQARPTPDGVWFQGSTRSLVYKLITATHFKVTTTVHPRKRTDLTSVPTHALHVGGLMARNPSSQGGTTENYLFVMAGHTEGNDGVVHQGVEVKTTTNGASVYDEPDWSSNDADLRICRLQSDFYLYKRVPGTTAWVLSNETRQAAPVSRPDLPDTLQVGMALNFSSGSDLDVAFDAITLAPDAPATVDDCTRD